MRSESSVVCQLPVMRLSRNFGPRTTNLTCRYEIAAWLRGLSSVVAIFYGYYDFPARMSFFKITESFRHAA
jgi:hypothetical protein